MPVNPSDFKSAFKKILPDEKFEEFLTKKIDVVLDELKQGKTKGLMPDLMVFFKDNFDSEFTVTPVFFADLDDNRHKVFEELGARMYQEKKGTRMQPMAVIFTCEAWMRVGPIADSTKVSDYEDKQECIIISGLALDGRANVCTIQCSRTDDGFLKAGEIKQIHANDKDSGQVSPYILGKFFDGWRKPFMADILSDLNIKATND